MIISICNNPSVMEAMEILGVLVSIIKIGVPILLMLMLMIDLVKEIKTGNNEVFEKSLPLILKRVIASILIFLIPSLVELIIDLSHPSNEYITCVNCVLDSSKCNSTNPSPNYTPPSSNNNDNPDNEDINDKNDVQNNKNPEYNTSYAYTNSNNGIKYIKYEQRDPRWNDLKFGSGTVGDRGCNMISSAVIASAYDSNITPYTIYNSDYRSSDPAVVIESLTNGAFNCQKNTYYDTFGLADIVKNNLKAGNPVVILVKGVTDSGKSKFTSDQHYMALIDISSDESQIYVGNSYGNSSSTYGQATWFKTEDVLTNLREVHSCEPTNELKNKFK